MEKNNNSAKRFCDSVNSDNNSDSKNYSMRPDDQAAKLFWRFFRITKDVEMAKKCAIECIDKLLEENSNDFLMEYWNEARELVKVFVITSA